MSEQLIKPYEISVWEDELTSEGNFIENKLAVIGSNTMTSFNRVYDPVFNKNANGEKTLSFALKYKYFNPYTEEECINPFIDLLTNERKVKLYYDNEWYEFIVKDHTESSDENTWEYTCNDAFVLELSKIGYNITFDSELNNNQGTARELAEKTIKDTDWRIPEDGVNIGKQLVAEPVYNGIIEVPFEALNTDTGESETCSGNVYVFYSYIKNKDGNFVQFIKKIDDSLYTIDDNNVITATNYRIIRNNITIEEATIEGQTYIQIKSGNTVLITIGSIETKYQVNRLAYNQLTTYDPVMERIVDRFKAKYGDKEIYRYTDYMYTTSNIIINYITNGENFNVLEDGTMQGWNPYVDFTSADPDETIDKLDLVTWPALGAGEELANINTLSQIQGYLKVKFKGALTQDYKNAVYNSGIQNHTSLLKSISKGQKFVFRWRAGQLTNETDNLSQLVATQDLRLVVAKYTQDEPNRWSYYYKHIDPNDIILQFEPTQNNPVTQLNNYIKGGQLQESTEAGKYNYVINNVVQTPSTKYIYVNIEEEDGEQVEKEYVWNGIEGNFELKTNSNYLPYYYLVAEAQKAIPNTVLTDSTQKYGIFIYTANNGNASKPYYLQDIQLIQYVPDASDGVTPILTGNIPTATQAATEYYYLKPAEGETADDIITYTDIEALKNATGISDIVALYNENSEKNLTITASQSNCFNILQTIAETFECWIDLVVDHDERGAIEYDSENKPKKYIYLKEYAGVDNWAGFKYGINLKSIERNINSEEIVTKLIVDDTQSDYVDDGFVSIMQAPSNTSGESYILNFDYFYNQQLLNRDLVEADRLNFLQEVSQINIQLQTKEKMRRDLEASMLALGSNRNVYTELVDVAKELKSEALGDFESLTHRTYDEYRQQQQNGIKYEDEYYILTQDTQSKEDKTYYTYSNSTMTPVENPSSTDNPYALGWYEKLLDIMKEETIVDTLGALYVNSATINNYSGIITNIEQEYWSVRKQLRGSENYLVKIWTVEDSDDLRHIIVELDDYLPGFQFVLGEDTYTSTVSKMYFDVISNLTEITLQAPAGYLIEDTATKQCTITDTEVIKLKINSIDSIDGIEDEIKNLQEQKDVLVKAFNNKYSRFIQEGTWNSTDYIDPELYYLNAYQVSNTSAHPTVSYTINVVEISELEGFEWYLFDAGDKSYIEDTEFFGWVNKGGIKTPYREEVIVSEVEWHLEEPNENVIKVQNYKTRFEDFFQRISATVQTVQYNAATYAKISTLLDADGTIRQDVLLDSLNGIAGRTYNLTSNGAIIVNDDSILIQNLQNLANRVLITSEGIKVSSDGGDTWATAIDGQGINIGTVYTGSLNTNEVVIGNRENPSFRWDKAGISAYKTNEENENTYVLTEDTEVVSGKTYYSYDSTDDIYTPIENIDPSVNPHTQEYYELVWNMYDLQTFVRFDQYGLYGIKNNGAFKAESLEDILDKAHFAVTWDGFFIKNSYEDGGLVSITSENDFQVIDGNNNERIKIGSLGIDQSTNDRIYGINISDKNGNSVLQTDNDGNLTITGVIEALGGNFSDIVTVGKNTDQTTAYIEINGEDASIRSSNYISGASESATQGWMIDKNGNAVFNNITARGAIKTAVFEYAEIQAVGGIFLFRPSSTIRNAEISQNGTDLIITVEKPLLFNVNKWCKVSNYTSTGEADNPDVDIDGTYILTTDVEIDENKTYYTYDSENNIYVPVETPDVSELNTYYELDTDSILHNNGLSNIYKITNISSTAPYKITLAGAATMVGQDAIVASEKDLIGGALVDMGNEAGTANYGIGINSSDNTINLPARAISLFETVINENEDLKVNYNYRGILGTLPYLPYGPGGQVHTLYHENLENKQGIFTDNIYIGDENQYLAFYTDENENKHLKINAKEIIFGYDSATEEEITWEDKIEESNIQSIVLEYILSSSNSEVIPIPLTDEETGSNYVLSTDVVANPTTIYYERIGSGTEEDPYTYQEVREYILTEDTEGSDEKAYYERSGEGTEENPYAYTLVEVTEDMNPHDLGYYEEDFSFNPSTEGYYVYVAYYYEWDSIIPQWRENTYLWVRQNVAYKDNTNSYSEPWLDLSWGTNNNYVLEIEEFSENSGFIPLTAHLYINGSEVTDDYEGSLFSWVIKSETPFGLTNETEHILGTGKTININVNNFAYSATIICSFKNVKKNINLYRENAIKNDIQSVSTDNYFASVGNGVFVYPKGKPSEPTDTNAQGVLIQDNIYAISKGNQVASFGEVVELNGYGAKVKLIIDNNELKFVDTADESKVVASFGIIEDTQGGANKSQITLGKFNNSVWNVMSSDSLQFMTEEGPIASFGKEANSNMWSMNISTARIEDRLYFGNFVWVSRDNGNISLKWIEN